SHERFMNALASLPSSDLQEMKEEDHGAEITCQFCQTTYNFDEKDLEELIRDKS
ncbi:Hsp33 family molecular chaperone HslO, partial [Streptococcus pneumoniae]